MTSWAGFARAAPRISTIFRRRHTATGNLCLLATLRADGSPRHRDPRFSLHTATVDTQVSDGDAKLSGIVHDVRDTALHLRFAEMLFADSGLDLRGQAFDHFYAAA